MLRGLRATSIARTAFNRDYLSRERATQRTRIASLISLPEDEPMPNNGSRTSPINLQHESLLPLTEVPRHLPLRKGKRTHYSTIYRWATKGVRGHVLESALVGGLRYTTHEALERFVTHAHGRPRDASHADAIDAALRQAGL